MILLDLSRIQSYAQSIESVQQNRRKEIQLSGYHIMKNIVRAFVVVLALTGAAASSQISSSNVASSNAIVVSKTSALPTPTCPLNDPNACNIRGGW